MNLMLWKTLRPLLAPEGEGAPAGDPPAGGDPAPNGDPAPAGDPPPSGDPAPAGGPDLSWLPEQFRTDGATDIDGFRAHYEEMAASQAIHQEALADVPQDATGYEFTVPDEIDYGELQLPEDFAFQLKTDDPALAPVFEELGGIMHKHNLPKGAAGELLGVLAKYQATEFSQAYAKSQQEYQALGPTADARISNINRTLDARLPADLATALKGATTSANGVKALEALLRPRGPVTTTPTPPEPKEHDGLASRYPTSS
ncbi:hypothetical protein [Tritonibacter mobilis]|uniref:hypothetical protein n=1 Tax=Tritonibacter mobilis TaxID=379347 RepID=UPI0008069094|nr:hypothetical protein [Tritonibacter mobilis]